jgi:hydrogenase expression/formation protein HypD
MPYIREFREEKAARAVAATIRQEAEPGRSYRLMEFCGGHTHAIWRYGLREILPGGIRFVHGPGCPVCVLPGERVDLAIRIAKVPGVILATYGDVLRVPASGSRTLLSAKAEGADVRMVLSTLEALRIARDNPDRQVVFLAIGFETTTPPTAVAVLEARRQGLDNFVVMSNHVLTPPALRALLSSGTPEDPVQLDGFIGPSHVSSLIGTRPYESVAEEFGKPLVVAGFEPLDVLLSVLMLVRQINEGRAEVENEYTRVVTREGNPEARALVDRVFTLRDSFGWRGLGEIPDSALRLRPEFAAFDAETRFQGLAGPPVKDPPVCECPEILRGRKAPEECRVFGTVCTPDNPIGSCMVSSEGACAAVYTYGLRRRSRREAELSVGGQS